jgi:hypothetical protein
MRSSLAKWGPRGSPHCLSSNEKGQRKSSSSGSVSGRSKSSRFGRARARTNPRWIADATAELHRSIPVLLGAGIVALIVIAGSAWFFLGANRPATVTSNAPAARADAAHLSIVVLPFRNLSDDPSQDYFADGITENLTTDLSRIRNSFVIARNTAFTFKGKNIAGQLSRALRVILRMSLLTNRSCRRSCLV